tara:strand:- start:21165 stop:22202 length:1038 start_codon:yes stop_codon:yes gene_type:complete
MSGSIGALATLREISYAYDVLGRRMQKSVKDFVNSKAYTRKFAYNGSNIIAEYDGNNALLAKYTHSPLSADDLLAAEISSQGVSAGVSNQSGVLYYLKDHQNSVTEIANEAGNVIQKFEYSSFGEIQKIKDGSDNVVSFNQAPVKTSFTYSAREFEPETGLYFYRARYYDSSNGRFLQQDLDPGNLETQNSIVNKYTYVGNIPTMYSDPSGKVAQFLVYAFIAAVISTAIQVTFSEDKRKNPFETFVSNFAMALIFAGAGDLLFGAEYIMTVESYSFSYAMRSAVQSGANNAATALAFETIHNSTGVPVQEMSFIFGFLYAPDFAKTDNGNGLYNFFSPPKEVYF